MTQTTDAFRRFEQHVVIASGKEKLEAEVQLKKRALDEAVSQADRLRHEYETLIARFDETEYEAALQAEKQMHAALGGRTGGV
jgi:uncharacterized protein with PIN domain